MSLRDISFILKKGQVNHGIVTIMMTAIIATTNHNEKATQAYKLFIKERRL